MLMSQQTIDNADTPGASAGVAAKAPGWAAGLHAYLVALRPPQVLTLPARLRSQFLAIWRFPVLRAGLLLALALAVLLPAVLYLQVYPAFERLLVAETEARLLATASRLSQALGQRDAVDLAPLQVSPELLRRLSEGAASMGSTTTLRLFDADGYSLYSSVPGEARQRNTGAAFMRSAVMGRPYSTLEQRGTVSAAPAVQPPSVVETYLPIRHNGRFLGVLEVNADVSEQASRQQAWLRSSSQFVFAVLGALIACLVWLLGRTGRALSLKQAAEAQLRESASVFEASSDAIFITDADGLIRRVNPAFTEMTGYPAQEVLDKTPKLLKSGRHDAHFYEQFWTSLHTTGHWEGEIFNRKKNGTVYPQWETVTALKDAQGTTLGYLAQLSEVARRKLSEDEIRYRANYDVLTGLPNRSLLVERLERALLEAGRNTRQVAVLFVDLDNFKQINDTHGHFAGDQLLQEAAVLLKSCVRAVDTVARQGGDEFVIILPDIKTTAHAARVARKIVERFRSELLLHGLPTLVTASVGVAIYPDDGEDVFTLFRNADLAMYRAKARGRNDLQFYEPAMTEMAEHRRHFEQDLRQALLDKQLHMHYQPIIDLRDGRMVGVEALMRWNHPQRGRVPPGQFIPLAEETGKISEVGALALETTCRQLAAWRASGYSFHASVNLSGRQILADLTPDKLLTTLASHGLQPADLLLEITEGALLEQADSTRAWVEAVRAQGFRIALDDFGTGYSSLTQLKRHHLDLVKIDQNLIQAMDGAVSECALVETIISLAHLLGMQVIAEGVETERQLNLLREMGCEYAQGFLVARPMPAEDLAEFHYADGSLPAPADLTPARRADATEAAPRDRQVSAQVVA
jgi:diguanylate cyclase (GGDEF)-like protein/PAS domain S-box-containing protein